METFCSTIIDQRIIIYNTLIIHLLLNIAKYNAPIAPKKPGRFRSSIRFFLCYKGLIIYLKASLKHGSGSITDNILPMGIIV